MIIYKYIKKCFMKSKKQNPILHPLFLKISNQCPLEDTFYRYLFEDMAYGFFPSGIYINDNYLICIRKNREFSLKLNEEEKTKDQIHILLKERAQILSDKDKLLKKQMLFMKKNKEDLYRKKSFMLNMLDNYIIEEGKNYKVSIPVLQKLKKFISNCLLFKLLNTSRDFTIDDKSNNIIAIEGINFEKRRIKINSKLMLQHMNIVDVVSSNDYEYNIVYSIQDLWNTFIL